MPGLSDSAETNLLKLIFQNIAWAGIGDVAGLLGSAAPGSLYISLHTADPTDAGSQSSSEAAYTNYARVAVVRSAVGWTVTGDTVVNAGAITFPQCGVTGATITHFGIGKSSSGAGELIGVGTCALAVSQNITPSFAAGALSAVAA
jgi:hypothetical protein